MSWDFATARGLDWSLGIGPWSHLHRTASHGAGPMTEDQRRTKNFWTDQEPPKKNQGLRLAEIERDVTHQHSAPQQNPPPRDRVSPAGLAARPTPATRRSLHPQATDRRHPQSPGFVE